MWERYCVGKYVKIDEVGILLFDIAALCIRVHDRTVKKTDLKNGAVPKKLEPYTKLLQSQIRKKDDPTGLTRDDFDNLLQEWLLLPLPVTTYGEKIKSVLAENEKLKIEISQLKTTMEQEKQLVEL